MTNGGKDEKKLEEWAQHYYRTSFGWLCSGRKKLLRNKLLIEKEENDIKAQSIQNSIEHGPGQ